MSNENNYIDGLIVKAPHENAPEYVKAKLSFKREELIGWLSGQSGDWINADVKVSQNGKWYAAVDTWKPNGGAGGSRGGAPQRQRPETATSQRAESFDSDEIPFLTAHSRF